MLNLIYDCFQDYCIDLLKEGEILGVAPGGSREAIFAEVRGAVGKPFLLK
jgi:hypothetical protein